MAKHIIEFDEYCKDCKGTGLYSGMAECSGVAVVCSCCGGTGCYHHSYEYTDFEGRRPRSGIRRVFETNPGTVVVQENDCTLKDLGGMSYEDWREGKPFPPKSEMRRLVCPAWWYQSVDTDHKPHWRDERQTCCGWGSFSSCKHFENKHLCWERWDEEFGG